LSPTGMAEGYLRTLAHVSRLLKNPIERTRLLQADSVKEIINIFLSFQDTQSPSSL
ncbi:MAG: hypothetical protein GQ559_06795, partial [Desulfobulbaceae bacterium]|nr:hypothetical protein [Desulfobulbaceae bacterium]